MGGMLIECWKLVLSRLKWPWQLGLGGKGVFDGGLFPSRPLKLVESLRFWLSRMKLIRLPNACTPATIL
jgi:hypothetical protein